MGIRLRLMQGAMALLYFGPLLAGLGGFGWRVVPVFAAIFLLWLVVMRPRDFPQSAADWRRPGAVVALLARLAVQVLLVAVCFGLGRGIGGVTGFSPAMPAMLPIGLSLVAVPLARLAWPPTRMAAMDAFLDEALAAIQTPGAAAPPAAIAAERELADRLIRPLADLPPDTPAAQVEAHLGALAPHLAPEHLVEALWRRIQAGGAGPVLRRAFILQATSPTVAEACFGQAAPVKALQIAEGDEELLALFARRCAAMLEQNVDAWGDCPNNAALEAARQRAGAAAARALADLMALNLRLAPLNGDGSGRAS